MVREWTGDKHQYEELVRSLPAAVYICDAEGRIVLYNDAAAELWGRKPEIGKDMWCGSWRIFTPEGEPLPLDQCPMAIALRENRAVTGVEIVVERPDGQRRHIQPFPRPLHDETGALVGAVNMLVDVTDHKHAETAMKEAKESAEAANRYKDRFLAVLSHELRTPLTPVLMSVAAMGMDPDVPPAIRDELAMIRRNVELETKLIDDLLDLSQVTSGKLQLRLQSIDLNATIKHVCEICRPQLLEKAIRLHTELQPDLDPVSADSARLRQVLWNILKNAVKFTPAGGYISVKTARTCDGLVRVSVMDSGIGISPESLPRLFEAFGEGREKAARQFGGMGLGLAISKALVELHRGSINVQSNGTGTGATFTIELPIDQRPSREDDMLEMKANTTDCKGLKVLIVEDHADTARMLGRLLSRVGYQVKTADCVASALTLAQAETFDVLVSDVGLPDATGYELMQQIKERYRMKGIAMSGYGMDEDIRKGRDAGFSEHLIKPVDITQLDQAIQRVALAAG